MFPEAGSIKALDRLYHDPRVLSCTSPGGIAKSSRVYFTRPDYPHECMQPVWKFQQYFTRVLV
ncbi:DUF4222 domain-containing protein [Klebsiella pneumoniae subsp. pneumoniae]|nr:DUF4222 domain-containing protein [Klebsiella pneumoniae subsp. pneumoniae]